MRFLLAGLVILMFASPVAAHELSVYTVIVNSEGAYPADIPNESLKEGDSAWFWMKDSTENTTLIVEIERDGASLRSPVLHFECELDDNGSQVNDDCKNRFDFTFNQHNSAGLWNITFMKYLNGTLSQSINGSVNIQEDLHDEEIIEEETEEQSSTKDIPPKKAIAGAIAAISLVAVMVILTESETRLHQEEE